MRVTGIELIRVALPLQTPFETSTHRKRSIEHILVRLRDRSGADGWGEIASGPGPWFSADDVQTAWYAATTHLAPALVGVDWQEPDDLARRWAAVVGHYPAKAGFDVAAWSLYSANAGRALAATLGATRRTVSAGVSIGIEDSIDALLERVASYRADGYHRAKLKIRPGWDADPVRAVRAAFPDLLLHVDANAVYRPGDPAVDDLDDLGLAMIEQPYGARELVAHAELARRIATPVCLDESIETEGDLSAALALGAVGVLNVKVSRVGGLTPALRLVEICRDDGIPVWCGGMHEFGIGRAANLALSARPEFDYPGDVSASRKYYERDLVLAPIDAVDGWITVPESVGLGVDVDIDFIRDRATATARFGDFEPDRAIS